MQLNTPELLFLKALVEDRIEKFDADIAKLTETRKKFEAIYDISAPVDGEVNLLFVRAIHAGVLRKIELDLEVPFQETALVQ